MHKPKVERNEYPKRGWRLDCEFGKEIRLETGLPWGAKQWENKLSV